jgi:hypothetical protein
MSNLFQARRLKKYVQDSRVFGVYWDRDSDPVLTRTDDAIGKNANVGLDSQLVLNDFDNLPIWGEMEEVTDSLGNTFIRIPKFYIKKEVAENYRTWRVSKVQYDGYYLPKVFWDFDNDRELPYFDFAKHKATKDGDNKLQSITDKYPLVNENIVDMRTYAENNGAGYQQLDVHAVDVIRTLMIIEFATLNIQTIMKGFSEGEYSDSHTALISETGVNRIVVDNSVADNYEIGQPISVGSSRGNNSVFYGRDITDIQVDTPSAGQSAIVFDGDSVDIAIDDVVYNTGWKNGFSANILATSGSISSNSSGKFPCSYRGIESPFGDIWQFVDGININDWQTWVCENAQNYASNVFASPYEQIGYLNHNDSGYVTEMGFDSEYPFVELAVEIGGSSSTYYSDYYYEANGQRIAQFGGRWDRGSFDGLSYWRLNFSSGNSDSRLGGRLLKKPLSF